MASLKDKIFKAFDFKAYNFDSSISTLAGIFYDLVRMYSIDIKSFVLEHSSPQSAILFLKEIINALRIDAGNFDFENDNLRLMVIELGINTENYLDSIYKLEPTDHPFSKLIFEVHRDNYLEKYNAKYIFDYLNLSKVYYGKLKRKNFKQLSQLLESETNLQEAVSRSIYKETTIQNLIDYVHIKTYLSTLDKLDKIIDSIFDKSITTPLAVTPSKKTHADLKILKAHHIGLLIYIILMDYGFDEMQNKPYLFASYFLLLLSEEPVEVVKYISNDLNISTKDQERLINTLRKIHERTPLHPDEIRDIKKWYSIANENNIRQIINIPEEKGTEVRKKIDTLRKWATVSTSNGGAFNLISYSNSRCFYDENKAKEILDLLQNTYPNLINDAFMVNFKKFEKECIQIAYNL